MASLLPILRRFAPWLAVLAVGAAAAWYVQGQRLDRLEAEQAAAEARRLAVAERQAREYAERAADAVEADAAAAQDRADTLADRLAAVERATGHQCLDQPLRTPGRP